MGATSGPQNPAAIELPPYEIVLTALRRGDAIPFLGAAASRVGCSNGDPTYLPSASDLAESLARKANFPSSDPRDRTDLSKVSSYYVDVSRRQFLRDELRKVFSSRQYRSNDLHRFLAAVAERLMIVTTNYDTLLEQAFLEAGKPYDLVVYPADNEEYANGVLWWRHGEAEPQKLRANAIDVAELGKSNLIYKMHGSVCPSEAKWDSFVITEEDYIKFLSHIKNAVPSAFRRFFSDRSFLFLGYGLKDWNLRVLLKEVTDPKGGISWAILRDPSPFETTLWLKRNVKIYNLALERFVAEMRSILGH